MMPRLQAEEQLREIDVLTLGIRGFMDADSIEPAKRRLHDRAEGIETKKAGVKAAPAQLGAIGIGVRQVPAEKALNRV
jgi:hypothetical protein